MKAFEKLIYYLLKASNRNHPLVTTSCKKILIENNIFYIYD